jgi:hypothetical protein
MSVLFQMFSKVWNGVLTAGTTNVEPGVFCLMQFGNGNVQLCNAPTSNRVSANLDDTLYKKLWILYSQSSHFRIITKASMKSEN